MEIPLARTVVIKLAMEVAAVFYRKAGQDSLTQTVVDTILWTTSDGLKKRRLHICIQQ
jgi:hypothetical protein